jgi:hypothetical protein
MFNNVALDVVIGLVFIYLLYSLLASIVQELIATQLAFRSKVLEKAILRMLEDGKTTTRFPYWDRIKGFGELIFRTNRLTDKKFAARFYGHPLIKYLAEDNWYSKPGYLGSANFSKIVVDLLNGVDQDGGSPNILRIKESLHTGALKFDPLSRDTANMAIEALAEQKEQPQTEKHINADTRMFLLSLVAEAQGDVQKFKILLEKWFDETMERASGWYKRYVQMILFVIGLCLAVAFNVDTIKIAKKLTHDPKLREQMVQNASTFLEQNQQLGNELKAKQERGLDSGPIYRQQLLSYEEGKARTKELLDSAKNLINRDIANVNDVIGLGYQCGEPVLLHIFFFCYTDVNFSSFIGWLITALAISLGAPFWFDMLSKLMRVRGALKKDPGKDESSTTAATAAPVTVTVNTKSGEEAVG